MKRHTLLVALLIACHVPPVAHAAVAPEEALPESAGAIATAGETISLDLKGVDIIDVLKLLSQKSGLNFVAGRNVAGRVTIFAKDVGVWEAFERICDANDLAYEQKANLITVMAARDYELLYGERFAERKRSATIVLKYAKGLQLATVLNQIKSSVGRVVVDEASNTIILTDVPLRLAEQVKLVSQLDRPTETRVYPLNYAEAEKLKDKAQELLTPGIGVFSFDTRTNKAIVTDLPEVVERIDRLIRAFDVQDEAVLIEAKIVKVELDDETSFGIDWSKALGGLDSQVRGNFDVLGNILGGEAVGATLQFINAHRTDDARILIEALQTFGHVETISNPRIAVANNQEAKILVGTKEAFVTTTTTVPATGSVVTSPEIQFVDVGTKLFVTPSIKRDGRVQLKIRPEVSTATIEEFQDNRIPIVSTTEAETNVMVQSGSTVIIGGLISDQKEVNKSQVPWLGNLPMVGAAFRSQVNTVDKTELVVFLTPQIITPSGAPVTDFSAGGGSGGTGIPTAEARAAAQGPVPLSYQTSVRELVSKELSAWLRDMSAGPGTIEASFVLRRDGTVVGQPQLLSAQGEAFESAGRAALTSAQFPPFPPEAAAEEVHFRVAVNYQPDPSQAP